MAQAKKALAKRQESAARQTIALPASSTAYNGVSRRTDSSSAGYGKTFNSIAVRDLGRFYELLQRGRQKLCDRFSSEALEFIAEVLRLWQESWNSLRWPRPPTSSGARPRSTTLF